MNKQKPQFGSMPDLGHPSREGLVLDLPMLGVGDLNDYSLNGNDGTNNGATWVASENGPVLDFTGSNSDVSGPLSLGIPLTIIARFKTGASGTARPFNVGGLVSNSIYTALDANIGNDFSFFLRTTAASHPAITYTAVPPVTNTWYTMALTTDGTTHNCYIDGQLVVVSTLTLVDTAVVWNGFGIGALVRISPVYSDNQVEYVKAYDRVLSEAEIKDLHDNPWQAWQRDNIALLVAAQPVGGVNLLDGLFERKRLVG